MMFTAGSVFGNRNSFARICERNEKNSLPQAKKCLGFVKRFSEFAKENHETCDPNFFNLTLIIVVVVFLIVQFMLFLRFACNN